MDKAMMVLGYITLASTIVWIIANAIEWLVKQHKNLFMVRLNKLNEDQLRHLISSASALLEVKERR